MKRSTALIVFTIFDLFGFLLLYWLCRQTYTVFNSVTANKEIIEYNTWMYLWIGGLIFPAFHISGLIEAYLPRYFNRSIHTKIIYVFLIMIGVLGITMTVTIKNHVIMNGYVYCAGASQHMKLSHFAVYVLNDEICHELTTARENRNLSSMR